MRKTRQKYHFSVKWLKRNENRIRQENLAHSLVANKTRDFWKEINRIKGSNQHIASNVDNKSEPEEIANLFATKFSSLYNSVSFDVKEMSEIIDSTNKNINSDCSISHCSTNDGALHLHNISYKDVCESVVKLKKNKKDGTNDQFPDNIIYGTRLLYVILSILFTCMLIHGICPEHMSDGSMFPIPKVKSTTNSDEFRAITLGSIFNKLFDVILLNYFQSELSSCNLQFGFKQNSSTAMCSFVVQEVLSHYHNENTPVYCTLLDASKAFDRIEFCKLFKKLQERKICPLCIRVLMFMYLNQKLSVTWNSSESNTFKVTNGVKQGGILSPVLFCLYVNELLLMLQKSGTGCYIGPYFCGCLGYADDIILLNPSVNGTRSMLRICESFAIKHSILFNSKKSHIIIFHKKCTNENLYLSLNGEKLVVVNKAKHLGHILTNETVGFVDFGHTIFSFNRSVNVLMSHFGFIQSDILGKLFIQYCSSLYGVCLINLTSYQFDRLCVAWRQALRRIYHLPQRTHKNIVYLVFNRLPIDKLIQIRMYKFIYNMMRSDNVLLKFIIKRCLYHTYSPMGNNVATLSMMYDSFMKTLCMTDKQAAFNILQKTVTNCYQNSINIEDKIVAEMCQYLIAVMENKDFHFLNETECNDILYDLCVN